MVRGDMGLRENMGISMKDSTGDVEKHLAEWSLGLAVFFHSG